MISFRMRVMAPALAVAWMLLGAAAHAQPEPGTARIDHAGLQGLLTTLGYQPREVRNEAGPESENVLRPPTGLAVTTRAPLSTYGTLVCPVAWPHKNSP